MIGDVLETKYFGTYTEERPDPNPAKEFVGRIRVKSNGAHKVAFFITPHPTKEGRFRQYDLPAFATKFAGTQAAILGREFTKTVGKQVYHKLVVISLSVIDWTPRESAS